MNILVFNGVGLEGPIGGSTAGRVVLYLREVLSQYSFDSVDIFNLSEANIPMLSMDFEKTPDAVTDMAARFKKADFHIWIAPMYHGSMPGSMKNCLDWLEVTAKDELPYLTDKVIGLVCWADGGQAMLGVNSMDCVAKALRAWVLPYSIPIVRKDLFDGDTISELYQRKLEKMVALLVAEEKK